MRHPKHKHFASRPPHALLYLLALGLLLPAACTRAGFDAKQNDGGIHDVPSPLDAPLPYLRNLVPSVGELSPVFSPDTLSYTVSVALWVDTITFTPTAPGATITINGQNVLSGNASQSIALTLGINSVTVAVDTGTSLRNYSVSVQRAIGVIDYLKASNTDADDHFGRSISMSGDTLAVGANSEASASRGVNGDESNNSALHAGAVYVFTRTGTTTWTQQAYLKASNAGQWDWFGSSISLSGDTLAVGAMGENSGATGVNGDQADTSADGSGAVYVFTRTGTTWSQQAYLKASNAGDGDWFGWSLSLSGDTLAVAGRLEDSSATGVDGDQADESAEESGAVYIFTRTGATWSQQAYLKASNTGNGDQFGWSISLSGNTLAVGALTENSQATGVNGDETDNWGVNSGAVYIFARDGSIWRQEAYLKASNTGVNDNFGTSVSLSGDTLAVGARSEGSSATGVDGDQADNTAVEAGAVYIFARTGTTWSQQAYLKASNTGDGDQFGSAVSLSGDTLAVGAINEGSSATGVDGDQADNTAVEAGAVYIFTRNGTTWTQKSYLKATNTNSYDLFGYSLSLSGDSLAVSAYSEDSVATGVGGDQNDNTILNSGAAYVFQ